MCKERIGVETWAENRGQIREGLTNGESSEDFKLQSDVIRSAARSFCQQCEGWIEGRWDWRLKISQGHTWGIYWEMTKPWTKGAVQEKAGLQDILGIESGKFDNCLDTEGETELAFRATLMVPGGPVGSGLPLTPQIPLLPWHSC